MKYGLLLCVWGALNFAFALSLHDSWGLLWSPCCVVVGVIIATRARLP
jgi:hypothetical protein